MKRFIFILFAMIAFITVNATEFWFKTQNYYYCTRQYNGWSNWIGPESSNFSVLIDLDESNGIALYNSDGSTRHCFLIQRNLGDYTDSEGNWCLEFECLDLDDKTCTVRYVRRRNGVQQLFVIYSNVQALWYMVDLN